jgi:EVE domain
MRGWNPCRKSEPMSAWIFQGNPKRWLRAASMNEYLEANTKISWSVRPDRLGKDIRIGDRVFIWRSVGRKNEPGGIVAAGHISAKPTRGVVGESEVLPDEVSERSEFPSADTSELWAIIMLDRPVRLDPSTGMLLRDALKQHLTLHDLPVIQMPQQTTYKLDKRHEAALEQEWNAASSKR